MQKFEKQTVYNPKILIVEDDYLLGLITQKLVQKNNYYCDIVNDGQAAVDLLSIKRYDLVFMDIQMPVMNGIEATQKIRETNCINNNVPIIALSSMDKDMVEFECVKAGMNEYISKPATCSKIKNTLNKYFKKRNTEIRQTCST